MPRALSDPEYVAFTNEVNLSELDLPPWGTIVRWGSIDVLVYVTGPPEGEPFNGFGGDLYLSDVTDIIDRFTVSPSWTYSPSASAWLWNYPAAVADEIGKCLKDIPACLAPSIGKLEVFVGLFLAFLVWRELR